MACCLDDGSVATYCIVVNAAAHPARVGNLGRAGYGASLEGMWPYSYDSCDWGTLPNQTYHGEPAAALKGNDKYNGGALSYLTGQRLSACTCPGEDHPGPTNSDGTFVGRAAPELDVFEATSVNFVDADGNPFGMGQVSQSCQFVHPALSSKQSMILSQTGSHLSISSTSGRTERMIARYSTRVSHLLILTGYFMSLYLSESGSFM